jgi:hypothetical protein
MNNISDRKSENRKNAVFPPTMWTDIAKWKGASDQDRKDLLFRFYKRYKLPLICFLKYKGCPAAEIDDILHDFILDHIEGKIFINADPSKGRFRNLLLTSLKHFLISRKRADCAEKRRPEGGFSYIDEEVADGLQLKDLLEGGRTPEEIYERAWLLALLNNVLDRLRCEYHAKGQDAHYILFERRVIQPIVHGMEKPSVQALASELGLSASDASNCIITAKRAYQRHLRDEIFEYVSSDKEVTEEINDLFHFLQNVNR